MLSISFYLAIPILGMYSNKIMRQSIHTKKMWALIFITPLIITQKKNPNVYQLLKSKCLTEIVKVLIRHIMELYVTFKNADVSSIPLSKMVGFKKKFYKVISLF